MLRTSTSSTVGRDVLPRHTTPKTNDLQEKRPEEPPMVANEKVTTKRGPRWGKYVSVKNKNHLVAAIGEFVGTTLFVTFAFGGTNVANIPSLSVSEETVVNTSQLLYISLAFGFSLCVNAWVFFRVSGGLFNPAVSLGLALVGAITWLRAGILVIAQLMGAMTGAAIIDAVLPGPLYVGTSLAGGISVAQGLFLEMFLTALLMITILLLAAEKHKATYLAPVGIGLALFIAEMTGVYYTGGSLNPARSFGPAVVSKIWPSYHWIYWLGPCLGASLAAALYKLLKYLQYEDVNPDQDGEKQGLNAATHSREDRVSRRARLHEKIQRAEAHVRHKELAHQDLTERRAVSARLTPVGEQPTLLQSDLTEDIRSAMAVDRAKVAELSAKLDAILEAVTYHSELADEQADRSSNPVPEAPHDAPFSVLA